jgi:hypothetical protein
MPPGMAFFCSLILLMALRARLILLIRAGRAAVA